MTNENRHLILAIAVLLLGMFLLACRDETAPGDLDTDLAEDVPAGTGVTLGWYGEPYPGAIGDRQVLHFWGGRMVLREPSGRRLYGTYLRTGSEVLPDGRRWNTVLFYPEGATGR